MPSPGSAGVHRIEAFSDAVFAFALTLLVVSLEVPSTFDELMATMRGFVPFAACFAVVTWLWHEHSVFFRQFGMADTVTVVLNSVLLFVVLFYVYPLKFVFTLVFAEVFGLSGARQVHARIEDSATLMTIYSVGFIVIFLCLAALYWHAGRRQGALKLDPLQAYDARAAMITHLLSVGVGVVSLIFTLALPAKLAGLSGYLYVLLGPVHGTYGSFNGRRRARFAQHEKQRMAPV